MLKLKQILNKLREFRVTFLSFPGTRLTCRICISCLLVFLKRFRILARINMWTDLRYYNQLHYTITLYIFIFDDQDDWNTVKERRSAQRVDLHVYFLAYRQISTPAQTRGHARANSSLPSRPFRHSPSLRPCCFSLHLTIVEAPLTPVHWLPACEFMAMYTSGARIFADFDVSRTLGKF